MFQTRALQNRRSLAVACTIVALASGLGCSSKDRPFAGTIPDGGFSNPNGGVGATAGSHAGSGASGVTAGGGGVSGNNPGQCSQGEVHASRVKPRVILVLDGSCSMTTDYPANGAQSQTQCRENPNGRWAAVRNALVDPQRGIVAKLQNVVEFGAVVFGTSPKCPIPGEPINPAIGNLQAITQALPNVQPGMFTPTGPALDWVYKNMIEPMTPDSDMGPQLVILATDGEPNSCNQANTNYQPSIDAVTMSQALGVKTYVISLADSSGEFHDHLQTLANLGVSEPQGMNAALYEPGSPQELEDNLQSLVGAAVNCDIALNGSVDAAKVCDGTVSLNGKALKCNDKNGFILSDPRHIRLQGTACDMLMATRDANVEATFPCGVFVVD